jgi:hypothetical protein
MKATLGIKEAEYFKKNAPQRIIDVKPYAEPYENLCEVEFADFVNTTMLFSMGVEYGQQKEYEFQQQLNK